MAFAFEQLARDLAEAWRTGGSVPLPETGKQPATRAEAYAVQDRVAELIGERVVGWKAGATVKWVQVVEGHDGPMTGRIFASGCMNSPANVSTRTLRNIKMECEFAFRLTRDLPNGTAPLRPDDIADALTFHPAFEISASRYAPGTGNRGMTTFDALADNGNAGAIVLGAAVTDWRKLPFRTMEIDAHLDGSPPIQMYGGAYRGDPLEITAEIFSGLRARGIALPAGTVLLTGSISLPTPARKGQTMTAKFGDLPTISVTLT